MQLLEREPRESGRSYALRTIKENIINLTLEPGSQISENELALEMGLSRTPVREAIIDLSKVKIIEIYPQKKSVISLIDYDLVEECQFVRDHLEKAVVQVVCEVATPEDIGRLQENVRLQYFYLDNFNPKAIMKLDNEFHELLFDIANKPMVYRLMNTISIHFDRVRNLALSSVKDLRIVSDHDEIVAAIRAHDAEKACKLMEVHLQRYKIDAVAIREKYPQYMKP